MSLLALQRDVRSWLAEESEAAAGRLGAGARPGLDVYLNNYRSQLIACLGEVFERVRLWLGEERFLGVAAAHIDLTPPSGWTLDAYAGGFPDTLERLFPDDPAVSELGWIDLHLAEAFVGTDSPALDGQALAAADWDGVVLRVAPTLATRVLVTNATAIWSSLSAGTPPPPVEHLSEPRVLLIWRKDLLSCFRTAEPYEAELLDTVAGGAPFAALCAQLVARLGEEAGVAAAGTTLGRWLGDGLVVDLV